MSNTPRFRYDSLPSQRPQLGEQLVAKALLAREDLERALTQQQRSGGKLGEILVGQGTLTAYRLHRELAEHLLLPFVDVERDPCDAALLDATERQRYLQLNVIPWRRTADGRVMLAATDPENPAIHAWATQRYGQGGYQMSVTAPYDIFWTVQRYFTTQDDDDARNALYEYAPKQSAKTIFSSRSSRAAMVLLVAGVIATVSTHTGLLAFLIGINLFFAATLLCKLLFTLSGAHADKHRAPLPPLTIADGQRLPIYTLLVPCYKEKAQTIIHLLAAIRALDYPKDRLDVKLVVEADDNGTINNIKRLSPESYFEIIRVPYSLPRTKPKACNYALRFARGQFVTIYDAEDKPEPQQLRKVLQAFANAPKDVVCVQAKLNYYNRQENLLTKLFALEYASWFHFMLPGLERMELPIPLGGTSNHFRTGVLRSMLAWDPYNVTEDADLGVRIAQAGFRTQVIDSTTWEEAPIHLRQWLTQRSRWIKGYMLTYLVHMRQPLHLLKSLGFKGALGFAFFVGAPPLVFFTLPFTVLLSGVAVMQDIALPRWLEVLAAANLFGGLLVHWWMGALAVKRTGWRNLYPITVLFPLYWVLHCVASFRAFWQMVHAPHQWDKTEHGLSATIHHTAQRNVVR